MNQDFTKTRIAIRYWQLGKEFHTALRAMNFAEQYHTGLRKDGITPEFQHQISQANFARTLITNFLYPEKTIATIWLHDVCEDYNVPISTIDQYFGEKIAYSVELLTNQSLGQKKPIDKYYVNMVADPIASLVKGFDRMHNHQSMPGVFTVEKQRAYILETETFIIPMLKSARKNFPEQESAYQNIKHILEVQMDLLRLTLLN